MKKVIVLLLALLISANIYCQSYFSVEGGYLPTFGDAKWMTEEIKFYEYSDIIYLNLDFKYFPIKYLWVGGEVNTYMLKDTAGFTFNPFYTSYNFNAGVKYNNMEIGYIHLCQHPVNACGYVFNTIFKEDSYYDEIYFKATFSF